ncbi:7-deoxyloganetin glucosyltransferase-like [Malania oleifera]|uniref:7-deoxyloganetin glucosyltransferase-like n=1 Tax=Malania oleifera TaxID=397392 RepID=UPI0025AE1E66|nr:7-deoxyloganetin glucosyltransferase-like [Malania oleifera]
MPETDATPSNKPHAVMVPYPAQGHVNPLMQFAKLLHARGFHITFVNTEFNHRRLIRSKGPEAVEGLPDFRFDTIPDGLPPSDKDATQDLASVCDSTRKKSLGPFRDLLKRLNSSPGVPPVTCIISDGVMSFTMKAARELGIPEAQFWTASSCGLMGYLHFAELADRGLVPFQDPSCLTNDYLETPLNWIPGLIQGIKLKHMPTFCRITNADDIMFNFMIEQMENCARSSAIIINTFGDFESEVLRALAAKFPRIYTTGPLNLLARNWPETDQSSLESSLWKENTECIDWLDLQEPGSVVYVNFGSIAVMSAEHVREFAWGLASCGQPFLWILRPDVVMGETATLPENFATEVKEKGLITTWCPQEKVLLHPAVGAFLTHTGWNSVLESLGAGVPLLSWPVHGEQWMNSFYVCEEWGIGMAVEKEVRREEIVRVVREMMGGEKGKKVKERVSKWKKAAEAATAKGGKSYANFEEVVEWGSRRCCENEKNGSWSIFNCQTRNNYEKHNVTHHEPTIIANEN